MPKKKGINKKISKDFTLNDSANAPKPLSRVKKSATTEVVKLQETQDIPWDEMPIDDEYDLIEKANPDGTMNLVCIKRRRKSAHDDSSKYNDYPEISWYHISKYIRPQDIGRFALINKATYTITQQRSFWYRIYKRHCDGHQSLPKRLHIEEDCSSFGLKTRVIRCLYFTHPFFTNKIVELGMHDSKPHELIKYRCINVWFYKGRGHWVIFLKFKKHQVEREPARMDLQDLEKIDANPERECKVLQINCHFFYEVPPLIGMTLTSVKVGLSRSLRSHHMFLGFNSSPHVSKNVQPECSIVLDTVISIMLIDWWHPNYPQFKIKFDWTEEDERAIGAQERNIFAPYRKNMIVVPEYYYTDSE